jgi:hypothetical protein
VEGNNKWNDKQMYLMAGHQFRHGFFQLKLGMDRVQWREITSGMISKCQNLNVYYFSFYFPNQTAPAMYLLAGH